MLRCDIRLAREGDAAAVSDVIVSALRETNAKHYSQEVIARVAQDFDPDAVRSLLHKRMMLVALIDDKIVGTASLQGAVLRTLFVDPQAQGRGIGTQLVAEVENHARTMAVGVLMVRSSITAEHFYTKLGFKAVGESFHGEECTIVMERHLL